MKCEEVEIIISARIDGEVTASEWREAEAHIQACANCAQTLALFQNSTAFVRQHAPQLEPSAAVWPRLARRLEALPKPAWHKKVAAHLINALDNYLLHPSITVRYIQVAAAAAVIVLAAVFLLQTDFEKPISTPSVEKMVSRQAPPADFAKQTEKRQFAQTLLLQEVQNYFEQVSVLLMEVKYLEPEADEDRLPQIRRASQNLLEETLLLKEDLQQPELAILSPVVEQLEIVLLDLANLKEKTEKEEVELLKATIVKQDLLIKIEIVDLKKMLRQDKDMLQRKVKVPQQHSINDI